jgi:outer membrane receptor protein involved in Fe transport
MNLAGEREGNILRVPVPRRYREIAAFTDFTVHVTDRFDVQLGGRESRITTTSEAATQTGTLGGSVTPRADSKANAFTYLVTPRLRVSEDLMGYARFASGYRAGGANFNPDPAVPRLFDPDKTQNYEVSEASTAARFCSQPANRLRLRLPISPIPLLPM